MSNLKKQIMEDMLSFRKERDSKGSAILGLIISDSILVAEEESRAIEKLRAEEDYENFPDDDKLDEKGKVKLNYNNLTREATDEQVLKVIKKMVTSNIKSNCAEENKYLEKYLPKQLTKEQILEELEIFVIFENGTQITKIGDVMKHFGTKFPKMYDGKALNGILLEFIKGKEIGR